MKALTPVIFTTAYSSPFAGADWPYRSRPDLLPPTLNITVPAKESLITPGYIFITPSSGFTDDSVGPEQPGAYIFRNDGDLVWSAHNYLAGWVADFRPDTLANGEQVLHAFQGVILTGRARFYGQHVILNNRYELVKAIKPQSHRLASVHEFNIINGRTVLIEVAVPVPADLAKYGGEQRQGWILSSGFQELDLDTGELIFEWHSFNHVDPAYSALSLNDGEAGSGQSSSDPWNYFHINSIDKNSDGDYLISARNYAAVFKINGTTGDIIWQFGGAYSERSNFSIPVDAHFEFQHNARFISQSDDGTIETISIFDNSAHSRSAPVGKFSRGLVLQLNQTCRSAAALRTQPAPDNLSAKTQGSLQLLPNGHTFINWGEAGAVSEFGADDSLLFHAYLDSAPAGKLVQSYRATKSNWTGFPTEEPALAVLNGTAYVSWNGDTETRLWRFFGVDDQRKQQLLGEVKRTSFETQLILPPGLSAIRFYAEARDATGKVLVVSAEVPADTFLTEGPVRWTGAVPSMLPVHHSSPLVPNYQKSDSSLVEQGLKR